MNAWSALYRTLGTLRLLSHLRRRPGLVVLAAAGVVALSVYGGPSFAATVNPSAPSSAEPTVAPSAPVESSPAPTVTATATETVTAPASAPAVQAVELTEPDRWLIGMPLALLTLAGFASAASSLIRGR